MTSLLASVVVKMSGLVWSFLGVGEGTWTGQEQEVAMICLSLLSANGDYAPLCTRGLVDCRNAEQDGNIA